MYPSQDALENDGLAQVDKMWSANQKTHRRQLFESEELLCSTSVQNGFDQWIAEVA